MTEFENAATTRAEPAEPSLSAVPVTSNVSLEGPIRHRQLGGVRFSEQTFSLKATAGEQWRYTRVERASNPDRITVAPLAM